MLLHGRIIAIACIVAGLGLLIGQDVIMKSLGSRFSVPELMFLRGLFSLALLVCLLPFLSAQAPLKSGHKRLQIMRGTIQFLSFCCYYIALNRMPLAELVAIFFSAPLIAVAMSAVFLRETVSATRWIAVGVGFCGALIVVRPANLGSMDTVALVALGAAMLYASSIVITRVLGMKDGAVTTGSYTLIIYAVLAGVAVLGLEVLGPVLEGAGTRAWINPEIPELALLLFAGSAVCIGFLLLAYAYRLESVSILAPWEYSALIWGGIYGVLFWNEIPDTATLLGGTMIIASGIFVARGNKPRKFDKQLEIS